MADRRAEIAGILRQRVISGLHLGTLIPGARLPSTRDVAEEFDVAPRTVMAAYRALAAEGLLELRQRSGIYVAGSAADDRAMLTHGAGFVVDVLLEARKREIPPIDFPERMRRCLQTLRLRAVCVAGNADQLDQICHELHEDYGVESTALEPEQVSDPDGESRRALTHADVFVTTSVHAMRVNLVARRLGKPAITLRLRQELWAEVNRLLPQGPIYLIGSDPRFRDAIRAVFDATGHGSNARALIVGEDDLDLIPDGAPLFIMRRAHEQLGNSALAKRVAPARRTFSSEMARELLEFIVRANIAAMPARPA